MHLNNAIIIITLTAASTAARNKKKFGTAPSVQLKRNAFATPFVVTS